MKMKLIVAAIGLLSTLSANAALTVVDFETVPGAVAASSDNAIPDGYAGLHWDSSFYALHRGYLPGSGYDYGSIGDWVGYSAYANPIGFSSDDDFNFKGGYIASAWTASESVTVKGYNNGVELYSTSLIATNVEDDLPQLFSFNWNGVDEIRFSGYSSHIVVDNLQLKIVPVPEPETYAMLMAGLGVMGFVARRRRER
jgi:hypothetical protein